jgi:hypothetical protein
VARLGRPGSFLLGCRTREEGIQGPGVGEGVRYRQPVQPRGLTAAAAEQFHDVQGRTRARHPRQGLPIEAKGVGSGETLVRLDGDRDLVGTYGKGVPVVELDYLTRRQALRGAVEEGAVGASIDDPDPIAADLDVGVMARDQTLRVPQG